LPHQPPHFQEYRNLASLPNANNPYIRQILQKCTAKMERKTTRIGRMGKIESSLSSLGFWCTVLADEVKGGPAAGCEAFAFKKGVAEEAWLRIL
jgi:hypothetical protein